MYLNVRQFCAGLFCLLVGASCIFSCQQSNDKTYQVYPGDLAFASLAVEHLLQTADSLPQELLQASVGRLPPAFQDSFCLKRLRVLDSLENDNGIKQTLEIYRKAKPGYLLAEGLEHYYQGIFYQYAGKFDSADIRYTLATKAFEQCGAKFYLSQALDKHSGNLTTQGHTDEAVPLKYQAIELLKETGQTQERMQVQMHLANVFNLKGEFDQAIALLQEPIAYCEAKKDTVSLAYMLGIKGSAYLSKKDYENALLYHKQALAMRQKIKAVSGITESLFHVGRTLLKMNRWQEALDTLRVAENAIKISTDKQGQGYVEAGIGEALFNLGRYDEADKYLTNGLEVSIRRKQYPAASMAAQRLYTVRKAQQRYAEALQYHEQHMIFKDSVFNTEKDKLSREFTVKYETREKELQINSLQLEYKLASQRNWWIAGSMLFLFAIGFYILRLRSMRDHQRLVIEHAKTEAQAQQLRQQLEIQDLELTANRTRLEDYAQMLILRNEQLIELNRQFEPDKTPGASLQPEDPENLFNQVILTEADWEKFQEYFNKVFPGYIAKLRILYTDLTPAEIRLVLLDKMGLSLKESSSILGVTVEAVKKGRYRLKKKYSLEGEDLAGLMMVVP